MSKVQEESEYQYHPHAGHRVERPCHDPGKVRVSPQHVKLLVTPREHAQILTALRLWQGYYGNAPAPNPVNGHGEIFKSLSYDDIDALVGRIK